MTTRNAEHLSEPWYSHIKHGRKTVEGRLAKGRFAKMRVGHVIKFYNNDDFFRVVITDIRFHATFKDYLRAETLEKSLPGIMSIKKGVDVYRQWYSEEKEKMYGVLAIEFKVL